MPLEVVYKKDGGILAKAGNYVTGNDMREFNEKIYATEEKIKNIVYQIIDYTDVEDVSFSDTDIDVVALQDRKAYDVNPDMLIAVVCKKDIIFGVSRMWEIKSHSPSSRTKVFRELDDARAWINEQIRSSNNTIQNN